MQLIEETFELLREPETWTDIGLKSNSPPSCLFMTRPIYETLCWHACLKPSSTTTCSIYAQNFGQDQQSEVWNVTLEKPCSLPQPVLDALKIKIDKWRNTYSI